MTARFGKITVSTLAMIAEHDTQDNHEVVHMLVAYIQDCQQITVTNSGNMAMMKNPSFFNSQVWTFF